MEFKDYYATLGVAKGADTAEIKRAYRKLTRKYHPDVSKEPNAEAKFKEINEAWEVLQDPEKRARYDQLSAGGWQGGQHPFGGGGHGRHQRAQSPEGFSFEGNEDFSDFFNSIFGNMQGGFGQAQHPGAQRQFRQPGRDMHTKINIALRMAYEGGTQSISLQVPARTPDGHNTVETKHLNVQIPKGIKEGGRDPFKRTRWRGDEWWTCRRCLYRNSYLPDPIYTVVKQDLEIHLPITPWEAALGATVEVPTLGGPVNLKIPVGAKSNQKMRLRKDAACQEQRLVINM